MSVFKESTDYLDCNFNGCWELIARVLLHDLSLIPSFSKVVKTLFDELINGNLLETTKISMLFAIKGYSIN